MTKKKKYNGWKKRFATGEKKCIMVKNYNKFGKKDICHGLKKIIKYNDL